MHLTTYGPQGLGLKVPPNKFIFWVKQLRDFLGFKVFHPMHLTAYSPQGLGLKVSPNKFFIWVKENLEAFQGLGFFTLCIFVRFIMMFLVNLFCPSLAYSKIIVNNVGPQGVQLYSVFLNAIWCAFSTTQAHLAQERIIIIIIIRSSLPHYQIKHMVGQFWVNSFSFSLNWVGSLKALIWLAF